MKADVSEIGSTLNRRIRCRHCGKERINLSICQGPGRLLLQQPPGFNAVLGIDPGQLEEFQGIELMHGVVTTRSSSELNRGWRMVLDNSVKAGDLLQKLDAEASELADE